MACKDLGREKSTILEMRGRGTGVFKGKWSILGDLRRLPTQQALEHQVQESNRFWERTCRNAVACDGRTGVEKELVGQRARNSSPLRLLCTKHMYDTMYTTLYTTRERSAG